MSSIEWSSVVALFAIGGLAGGLFGGKLCKFLGRRNTLLYNNTLCIIAGLIMALSLNPVMFGIGRILVGFACGVSTAAVPMYVAEISPTNYRGAMGTLHQLSIVFAILISQLLGLPFSTINGWRLLVGFTVVPSLIQLVTLPFCVKSPNYLASKGQINAAERSLKKLRASNSVREELESIMAAQVATTDNENLSFLQLFKSKSLRKALIIALSTQLAQQLSGINGVLQFSSSLFEKIAPGKEKQFTVGIGVTNLIATLLAVYLMDRAGRRSLLMLSQFGMAIVCTFIVVASVLKANLLTVILVFVFVAIFAVGLGPIPWLILPEIFPTYAISPASSISVMVNWGSNFVVSLVFETVLASIAPYSFLPFAAASFVLGLIIYFMLPETKGKSLDEVVSMLQ